ncbi:MAG: hypothetical protein HYX32_04170 [Actinobacteria bacterium]|nr:hypothetical protein [Actinomycetota bacterium]
MPVRKTNPRTVIVAVGTFAIGAILVVGLFVFAVGRASESGRFEVKLGSDTFDAGSSQLRAESIAADGPFLFSDVAGGQRDIFLQHEGDDPKAGWLAFDARKPGEPRDCQLVWEKGDNRFRDSCDGTFVAANGEGLPRYPVEVNDQGNVIVNLNADKPKITTTTVPPATDEISTTSTIKITGAGR